MRYEASTVKVERIKFTLSKKGLKIIQLSDIHIKYLKVSAQTVRKVIERENPDIIIFTGDYIDKPNHINKFLYFLEQIKSSSTAMYLCLGNHDYEAFEQYDGSILQDFINMLENQGITVLHNRAVCYTKNSVKYNVIGIEDLSTGKPNIDEALYFCSKEAFVNIAFSHNPDIVFEIPKGKVDFLFCGHFHGGQIWMPFNLEFKLLRKEILCKMGITRGLHRINGINLYINRGLGNVCFPLRFLSKPEITIFHLP
jgi:predicted MPP superfamily phosphohydrolase